MQSSGSARSQGHRPCRSWAAGCVLDGLESCVLGCLSCCSVLLVGLVLCPWGGVGSSVIVCRARPGWRYPGWSCFLWWWTIWWALPFLEGRARRLPPGRPPSAPRSFPPRGMFRISRGARRSWAEMYRGAATRKVPQGAGPQDLTTSATVRSPHPQHQGRPATRAHHCTSMPTQSDPTLIAQEQHSFHHSPKNTKHLTEGAGAEGEGLDAASGR